MIQTTSIICIKHRLARWVALSFVLVASSNAAVVPHDQSYAGKTYPEWMAASWISSWAIPSTQVGGADLRSESSRVWYLWAVGSPNPATLYIRVPHDQALFVTFDGVACSIVEEPPFHGGNEAELLAALAKFRLAPPFCEIDGIPVPDLNRHEFISPLFDFYYPSPNIGGVPGSGWSKGMGRGTSVLVHSLTPGLHTIHFRGGSGIDDNDYSWDVTYQITVYTRPTITIRTISGTNLLELSWPVTSGFVLEEADSLNSSATWRNATVLSTNIAEDIQSATVTTVPTSRFYRLHQR